MDTNIEDFKNKNETLMKSKSVFDDDSNPKYRYLLLREWDKNKDKIAVVLSNPSDATYYMIQLL